MIGSELRDAEQADRQGRAGQLVGLEGDGDEGRHRAQLGDRLAQDEQAELAPPAQQAEVDGDRSQARRHADAVSGVSGTGAVNGAQATSWPQRAHLGWRDGRVAPRDGAVVVSVQP